VIDAQAEEYERIAQMRVDVDLAPERVEEARRRMVAEGLADAEAAARAYETGQAAAHAAFAPEQPEKKPRFTWQDAADLLSEPDPKPLWLVDGLLPEEGVCVISGEPKATKTWAAMDLAVALASATPAFGEYAAKGRRKVALFQVEDSKRSVKTRLRVLTGMRSLRGDDLRGWMRVICRGQINLQNHAEAVEIAESVKADGIGLLVLDPLRDLHSGDENDSTAMKKVMDELRWLREELKCAVLFVHHSGKSSKDTDGRRPGQKMRGSGAVHGAVDAGIYMQDTKTDLQTFWTNKVSVEIKEGSGAGVFGLTLHLDNVDGVAQSGTWELADANEDRAEQAQAAVVAVLQAAPGPMGMNKIRKAMPEKLRSERVIKRSLERLRSDNRACEVIEKGRSIGWALTSKIAPLQVIASPLQQWPAETPLQAIASPIGAAMAAAMGPLTATTPHPTPTVSNGSLLSQELRASLRVAASSTREDLALQEAEALAKATAVMDQDEPKSDQDRRYP